MQGQTFLVRQRESDEKFVMKKVVSFFGFVFAHLFADLSSITVDYQQKARSNYRYNAENKTLLSKCGMQLCACLDVIHLLICNLFDIFAKIRQQNKYIR